MASKCINLGYKFSSFNLIEKYGLCQKFIKLKPEFLRICASNLSTISADSSVEVKRNVKKNSKLSTTDVIYIGDAVLDKVAKVQRLKASQIPKVRKGWQKEIIKNESASNNNNNCNESRVPVEENFANFENVSPEILENIAEPLKDVKENLEVKKIRNKLSKKDKILLMYQEFRLQGRIKNFNETLAAYISVCVHAGYNIPAYQTFSHFLKHEKQNYVKHYKILSILSYNEVLKGIAKEGDYKKMSEVLKHLKKSEVTPTRNTFAHILTCLGRNEDSPSIVGEIESTLQWMDECKIDLNELFTLALFLGDGMQYCLQAVEKVIPNIKEKLDVFSPTVEMLQKKNCYNSNLVNSLNEFQFTNKVSSPAEGVLTQQELSSLIKKQIDQEIQGFVKIPNIYKEKLSKEITKNRNTLEEYEAHWRETLSKSIIAQKQFINKSFLSRENKGLDFYPYFVSINDEDIINLLMLEINNLCMCSDYYSPSLNYLASQLGDEFFNRFVIKYKQRTNFLPLLQNVYEKYCHWYLDRSAPDTSYVPRIQWNKIAAEEIAQSNLRDHPPEWPYTVKLSIGKRLYDILISSIVVWKPGQSSKKALPAFYKVHRTYNLKIREELKPSPILMDVIRGSSQKQLIFSTGAMPMLSPPVPWTTTKSGGYFVSKSNFVRTVQHAYQQKKRMKDGGLQKLFPVMDSLNQLGSIPWKINNEMLDLIIEIFNNKGWEKMEIIPPSSELPQPPPILSSMSSNKKKELQKEYVDYKKKKLEMNSLWCDMLYKLSIANFYRDNVIWLPQNMDFRGRTYPIPPHLTHLSSDVFRSLMLFAQGKKLGKDGLSWLKLHIINLTGKKKKSCIEERLTYCEEIMPEIYDSATNPLNGRKWWTESDEPWQTLAACKELVAALESGNPEEYVSRLPIHQDGSCNGLQHYAALGRDKSGAESVNLRPFATPKDVYARIVELVEEERKKDAENGVLIAQILEGVVQRKVIKQTVMTTVYGVTRFGAKLQILKQLNYLDDFPEKHRFKASSYLTAKTFESLGTIFSASKAIQNWLVKLAEGICKGCINNVEWETPLGFPVVQPYSKHINIKVTPGKINYTFDDDIFLKPNVMKQKNAFPPNFIHSLDSSHMMLTSIFCQHAGITFVSIHDCFWTHASTVPVMNKICREQFVKLHSEPILDDLAKFMHDKYSNHTSFSTAFTLINNEDKTPASFEMLLKNVPQKGKFDIREVLKSVFFFS